MDEKNELARPPGRKDSPVLQMTDGGPRHAFYRPASMKHDQELSRGRDHARRWSYRCGGCPQAAVAEAGAVAVMALERVPADIRSAGGLPDESSRHDRGIIDTTSMIMAKARVVMG